MKVVIADRNLARLRAELEAGLPPDTRTEWPDPRDAAAVVAAVADADVLVCGFCSAAMADAGSRLRLVHVPGAGTDAIEVAALSPGVAVANTHHHEDSIAEYIVGGVIVVRRGIPGQDRALREGRWTTPVYDTALAWQDTLATATVGFVGFGHIGARTWERFRAFGAGGVAVTRSGDVDAAAFGLAWSGTTDDLATLLGESDVVVVSAPLTPETTGMIGEAELARMPGHAVLVNVGRGPLVDERALFEALRDNRIGGAVLDVWYRYPGDDGISLPANLPFHELPNVLMTPHSSGLTRDTFAGRAKDIAANIRRLAAGEPLADVVVTR
jgi:phosphoglycerate dehydrogenase-like enzyme